MMQDQPASRYRNPITEYMYQIFWKDEKVKNTPDQFSQVSDSFSPLGPHNIQPDAKQGIYSLHSLPNTDIRWTKVINRML